MADWWRGQRTRGAARQPDMAGIAATVAAASGVAPGPAKRQVPAELGRTLAGVRAGRVTQDRADWWPGQVRSPIRRRQSLNDLLRLQEAGYRYLDFDEDDLASLLIDASPELSKAVWDYLREANPGFKARALRPGSMEVDEAAQAALDGMLATLRNLYGSENVPINRLFFGAFQRGAFFAEVVLGNRREFVDLATPDPALVLFQPEEDPQRGQVWKPYQRQRQDYVSLDWPTIRYVPLDPAPGDPYGRAMATPSLFVTLFTIHLLSDLRRVIMQQGYPRLDIIINLEALLQGFPELKGQAMDEVQELVRGIAAEVKTHYANLQPDDAFIHSSVVELGKPQGVIDSSVIGAIDGLIQALSRYQVQALKTTPLAMGETEGMSEAAGNRQAEARAAAIRSLQHAAEQMLEHLFGIALQAQGFATVVEWRFAELRKAEMLRDAQTLNWNLRNALLAYWAGLINLDEAAEMALQRETADQQEPRIPGVGVQAASAGAPSGAEPEPGTQRARKRDIFLRMAQILDGLEEHAENGHADVEDLEEVAV